MQPLLSFTDARIFLAAALPWNGDWNSFHWVTDKVNDKGKPFWSSRAFNTFDAMVRGYAWTKTASGVRDLYVCMSSQRHAHEKISQKGYPYFKMDRGGANAVALKSFYIDVDVKEGAYASTHEAMDALIGFIAQYNLPRPSALVASGSGGFHVHWILDQPIARDEWLVLSAALAYIIKQHGLKADTGCTIDCARVLRIPGTQNFKHTPPKSVNLLIPPQGDEVTLYTRARIEAALKPFVGLSPVVKIAEDAMGGLPRRPPVDGDDALGAGIDPGPVPDLQIVREKCAFVNNTLNAAGTNYSSQPLWHLMVALCTHTKGGIEDLYRMTLGSPHFNQADTDAMFDRVKRAGKGWVQCHTLKDRGCKECETCPLLKENKSPLNFGMPALPALTPKVSVPVGGYGVLPEFFSYDMAGHVVKPHQAEDGTIVQVQVCDYAMMNAWIEDHPTILHFDIVAPNGHRRMTDFTLQEVQGKEVFTKALSRNNMAIMPFQVKLLQEFMVSWIRKLQNTKEAVMRSEPFGWVYTEGGKIDGFSYGGKIFTPQGGKITAQPDPVMADQYRPRGDVKAWMEAASMVLGTKRSEFDAILAASFGAPLMEFVKQPAVIISSYSTGSGYGKTTAMKVAQAVWGNPTSAMMQLSDTQNAAAIRMGMLKSLPLFWDEIRGADNVAKFTDLTFQVSSGKGKGRATVDLKLQKVTSWKTLMVTTNNFSLQDPIQQGSPEGHAGLYRLFEFEAPGLTTGNVGMGKAARIIGGLEHNFGLAGLLYSEFLGAHHEVIQKEVDEEFDRLEKQVLHPQGGERFWVGAIAAMLMGAKYAKQLGLVDFDINALTHFLIGTFLNLRGGLSKNGFSVDDPASIREVIGSFLTEQQMRNTAVTDKFPPSVGRPPLGCVTLQSDPTKTDTVNVHKATDENKILIRQQEFINYLRRRKLPERQFLAVMERKMGVIVERRKMAAATVLQTPQVAVFNIDLNHKEAEGLA